MIVDLWMTHDPICIDRTTSVSKAALLMVARGVRRLLIVDRASHLVGVVSSGDVARAFPPDLNPVSAVVTERSVPQPVTSIMTRQVYTVASGTVIDEAAQVMRLHRVGAVPVVSGDRILGIITESDVFRAFVEMNDGGTAGLRVTFDLAEDEDVTSTMVDLCREHHVRLSSILSFHHRDPRTGDSRRLGVVRMPGTVPSGFLDALWRSHHRVLSVVETKGS